MTPAQKCRSLTPEQSGRQLGDRPADLPGGHRSKDDLSCLQRGGKLWVAEGMLIEVSTQGQDD